MSETLPVPEWYMDFLLRANDDTLLLDWELAEGENIHKGYCKFCKELLYYKVGSPEGEYTHMVKNHPEEIAIFRIGSL